VRVWDASTGAEVAMLEGHGDSVYSVAWSGEGEGARLASGGQDGTVRVWDDRYTDQLVDTLLHDLPIHGQWRQHARLAGVRRRIRGCSSVSLAAQRQGELVQGLS